MMSTTAGMNNSVNLCAQHIRFSWFFFPVTFFKQHLLRCASKQNKKKECNKTKTHTGGNAFRLFFSAALACPFHDCTILK